MRYLVTAILLVVGVVHLLPLTGVLGKGQLEALYGVPLQDANLIILMRHRAVLFGLLGAFFVFAAFAPQYQLFALTAGSVSVGSFLWLAWSVGGYNVQTARVFRTDIVALICLAIGFAVYIYQQRQV